MHRRDIDFHLFDNLCRSADAVVDVSALFRQRPSQTTIQSQHPNSAMASADSEPFPPLSSAADRQLVSEMNAAARRRRKSSGLGNDLRVGDTGAPALATSLAHLNGAAQPKVNRTRP